MRIYDISDHSREPLAEGRIPWSPVKLRKVQQTRDIIQLHNTQERHRELEKKQYQMTFCSGRIWITGVHKRDLLSSSPPHLLRRLRSRLSLDTKKSPLSLQFVRIKADLCLGTHHTMQTWNDSHLYVIDATGVYCWSSRCGINRVYPIKLVCGSETSHIISAYIDGTKIITCTNTNDGSGDINVTPIDVAAHPPSSYISSSLQVYHKKLFHNVASSLHSTNISTNSNYKLIDASSDGRYVLVRCEKGSSAKIIVLDLYNDE